MHKCDKAFRKSKWLHMATYINRQGIGDFWPTFGRSAVDLHSGDFFTQKKKKKKQQKPVKET